VLLFFVYFYFASTDRKEIDPNDVDFEKISGSLTRKQAEAVRKRIDTLNQSTKKKLGLYAPPSKTTTYPTDVRTIFPAKTNGQPSNAEQMHTTRPPLLRKSYSEGIHALKLPSFDNDMCTLDNDLGHSSCRHSKSADMLSSMNKEKEFSRIHLHPEANMERRSSDEMRYRTGNYHYVPNKPLCYMSF